MIRRRRIRRRCRSHREWLRNGSRRRTNAPGYTGPSLCNERVRRAGPKQLRKVLCLLSVIEHATVRAAEG